MEGKRERGVTEGGAAGSAAVRSGINFVCFEDGVTVWCCGQDWCDSAAVLQVTGTTGTSKETGESLSSSAGFPDA